MRYHKPAQIKRRDLTAIQTKVLKMVADGHMNQEIADALYRSKDGIDAAMRRILAKLEARNRTHAVALAIRRGII